MITEPQKKTAQAIVNIFETGTPLGDYGKVTILKGDSGHLTYGRSQTTLASGNLYLLIKSYCEDAEAQYASPLRKHFPALMRRDNALDTNKAFHDLLRSAGVDPTMHKVQDEFFDRVYWSPAVQSAEASGIGAPLGTGVVYDSCVHGSWRKLREVTSGKFGGPSSVGEKPWVSHYVSERRNWLATHSNPLLHRTVYRMDAFKELIDAANWELRLPIRVRGILIDEAVISAGSPLRVSAQDEEERVLLLKKPPMKGEDVKRVQRALNGAGFRTAEDGVFGAQTAGAVKDFQNSKRLKADGIVGPATLAALGL